MSHIKLSYVFLLADFFTNIIYTLYFYIIDIYKKNMIYI